MSDGLDALVPLRQSLFVDDPVVAKHCKGCLLARDCDHAGQASARAFCGYVMRAGI